jgi:hypothetical protein
VTELRSAEVALAARACAFGASERVTVLRGIASSRSRSAAECLRIPLCKL